MSEATITLTELRRKIALELQMPFARRYSAGFLDADSGGSTTKFVDSALTQKDRFWDGNWFYRVASQEVSIIRGFSSNDNSGNLEVPVTTIASGDDYEIHSIWNALDIRHAINSAIAEAGRIWPDTVVDESLILQEDKLDYTISGLTQRPWIVAKVFIENRGNIRRGTLVSATSTTFVVENTSILSDVSPATNWRISIYAGTGAGQIRTVSSVASATGTVTAWTTTPDSTSKYALWDATEDIQPWSFIDSYRTDAKEFPSTLYLTNRYSSRYGMRIHIEYMSTPSELSLEADTTIIPHRFLVPMAISYLYGNKIADTKVDKEVYYAESERYRQQAERYLINNLPHKPDITMKLPLRPSRGTDSNDPLDWYE